MPRFFACHGAEAPTRVAFLVAKAPPRVKLLAGKSAARVAFG